MLGPRLALQHQLARCTGSGYGDIEYLAADQIFIGHGLRSIAVNAHNAIGDDKTGRGCTQALRGEIEQRAPRLGAGLAQLRTGVANGGTADGGALVNRLRGIAHHHLHRGERNVQLLGDDLRERGFVALAQLHSAGINGDGAVRAHREPGIERAGRDRRERRACGRARAAGQAKRQAE